jgi:hypothetical protein
LAGNPVTTFFLDDQTAFIFPKRLPVLGNEVQGPIRIFQSNANNTFAIVARALFPIQGTLSVLGLLFELFVISHI